MSKKFVVLAIVAALMAAIVAVPAEAAKKKKKKPKPVATTLYMHGQAPLGEIDGAQWFAEGGGTSASPESPMTIDAVEPEGGSAKSMAIGSPVWNSQCTGLPLGFPTFTGKFAGTIVGDAKIIAHFEGVAPAAAVARIWVDMGAFQNCNDAYVPGNAEATFDATNGEVEIPFTGLNFTGTASIMIEILIEGRAAPNPRLQYDSPDALTRFEFSCIPPAGAKSCIPE